MAQYYDEQLGANSKQFEKRLFAKTKTPKTKDEILVLDGVLIVHKFVREVHLYVVSGRNENPLVLDSVLNCVIDVINTTEINSPEYRSRVILAFDEICDSGIVLENDSNLVVQRIESSQFNDDTESFTQRAARRFLGI